MPSAAISESLEWLSKVFAGAGAGAWRADVETGLVEYTESLKEVFGMERPVMLLRDWIELLHPEDCPHVIGAWEAATRGEANYAVEYRVVDSKGTIRWIEARGFLEVASDGHRVMFGFCQDATARKTAERQLSEAALAQAEHNQALAELSRSDVWRQVELTRVLGAITEVGVRSLQVARVGIWLYDEARSKITLADLFEQTTGRHDAGQELPRLANPPYFEALDADRAINVVDAQSDPRTCQFGPDYLVPLGITSMLDAPVRRQGKSVGVVCCESVGAARVWTGQDISFAGSLADYVGLALEHEEKRQIEAQLLHSQKLESVGRLAGGVAHDFNNLLTAITGSVELAHASALQGVAEPELLDEIRAAAERATSLTGQLLTFARRNVISPQLVKLHNLIQGSQRLLARVLGQDIDLELRLGAQEDYVLVDPGQFEQLLMNLAVNARDAMPGGGTLRIETTVEAAPDPVSRASLPSTQVVLLVRDSGVGIAAEHLGRIFEPFFTTKERGRGTGLGLSTCYGIVEQAGGGISATSKAGQGTEFRICLPLATSTAERAPVEAAAPARRASGETILVIEDDDAVRRLVVRGLERLGYRVWAANCGADGLTLAAAHPEIQVVILDVIMPGMSGIETARFLSKTLPRTPILFVSGYTEDTALRDSALRGDLNFLAKPFSVSALSERLRLLLEASKQPAAGVTQHHA
jgi:PAS domain S-box-containing protein